MSFQEWIIERAREAGSLPGGSFQVVVLEPDDSVRTRDFTSFEVARGYADDAASETDSDSPPVALVLDGDFVVVHEGAHYASR